MQSVKVNPETKFREENEVGIIYFRNKIFRINNVGLFIWKFLIQHGEFYERGLENVVSLKYDVLVDTIRGDVRKFIADMKAKELLREV